MKIFTLAAAAIGLAVTAAPAMAETEQVQTTTVSVAGLDLSTVEGQKMLERRIKSAARKVCDAEMQQTGSRIRSAETKACYREALASVQKQVAIAVANQQRGG